MRDSVEIPLGGAGQRRGGSQITYFKRQDPARFSYHIVSHPIFYPFLHIFPHIVIPLRTLFASFFRTTSFTLSSTILLASVLPSFLGISLTFLPCEQDAQLYHCTCPRPAFFLTTSSTFVPERERRTMRYNAGL